MAADFSSRVAQVRSKIREAGLDALWITGRFNIRYLTGFTGSAAQVWVTPEETLFLTDGRYQEQVKTQVHGCRIRIHQQGPWTGVFAEECSQAGWKRIGYESAHLTCDLFDRVRSLPGLAPEMEWIPTAGWIESLRLAKQETEIESLRKSSRIVDAVFEALLPEFREGITEKQILQKMMNLMWELGGDAPSFDPIVLFGARSSLPHGQPTDARLKRGDWVLMDFGFLLEGYCSDFTRTFVFGQPDPVQRERHAAVLAAHDAAIEAAAPGMACKDLDAVARGVLAERDLEEFFIHGLGHGVGLEIHEGPRVSFTSEDTLLEGMAVTIEPGVYIPGWGGIRIEDAIVIGLENNEVLTHSDRAISVRS